MKLENFPDPDRLGSPNILARVDDEKQMGILRKLLGEAGIYDVRIKDEPRWGGFAYSTH